MKIPSAFAAVCCLVLSIAASGQSLAGSNWQRVEQLPLHTRVHVSADGKSRVCSIDSVDDEKLTCSAGRVVETGHYTFQRSTIKSIKVSRYLASTAIGAGIGAGAGAISLAAVGSRQNCSFICIPTGELALVGAAIFAIPGAAIGLGTDFARGPTIYHRQ